MPPMGIVPFEIQTLTNPASPPPPPPLDHPSREFFAFAARETSAGLRIFAEKITLTERGNGNIKRPSQWLKG